MILGAFLWNVNTLYKPNNFCILEASKQSKTNNTMTKSRFAREIHNQGISNIEDDIIRGTFPKYDRGMSSIITEQFKTRKPLNCDCEVFCGWFTARIYVGNHLVGRYKFDCTSFDVPYFTEDGNEQTKVTKIN